MHHLLASKCNKKIPRKLLLVSCFTFSRPFWWSG
eukprot:UN21397